MQNKEALESTLSVVQHYAPRCSYPHEGGICDDLATHVIRILLRTNHTFVDHNYACDVHAYECERHTRMAWEGKHGRHIVKRFELRCANAIRAIVRDFGRLAPVDELNARD